MNGTPIIPDQNLEEQANPQFETNVKNRNRKGATWRVWAERAAPVEEALRPLLAERGVALGAHRRVAPGLEDVFVALLAADRGPPPGAGSDSVPRGAAAPPAGGPG